MIAKYKQGTEKRSPRGRPSRTSKDAFYIPPNTSNACATSGCPHPDTGTSCFALRCRGRFLLHGYTALLQSAGSRYGKYSDDHWSGLQRAFAFVGGNCGPHRMRTVKDWSELGRPRKARSNRARKRSMQKPFKLKTDTGLQYLVAFRPLPNFPKTLNRRCSAQK